MSSDWSLTLRRPPLIGRWKSQRLLTLTWKKWSGMAWRTGKAMGAVEQSKDQAVSSRCQQRMKMTSKRSDSLTWGHQKNSVDRRRQDEGAKGGVYFSLRLQTNLAADGTTPVEETERRQMSLCAKVYHKNCLPVVVEG